MYKTAVPTIAIVSSEVVQYVCSSDQTNTYSNLETRQSNNGFSNCSSSASVCKNNQVSWIYLANQDYPPKDFVTNHTCWLHSILKQLTQYPHFESLQSIINLLVDMTTEWKIGMDTICLYTVLWLWKKWEKQNWKNTLKVLSFITHVS